MTTLSISRHNAGFTCPRTYLVAALFILGNIALPQLIHLIPGGGLTWLPIYFFTLIGAWLFGWRVGLVTAVFSPLINSLLFGMPAAAMLPVITVKSVLLATAAGYASDRSNGKASLPILAAVVAFYQITGSVCEWVITGSLSAALADITVGLPGILFQILGGWALLRLLPIRSSQ